MPVVTEGFWVWREYPKETQPSDTVFRAGDTVYFGCDVYNDNWLPVWFVPIYFYFGKKGNLQVIKNPMIPMMMPYEPLYISESWKIPENIESGYYQFGFRTIDEDEVTVIDVYIQGTVQPPEEPTVARLSITTQPVGAEVIVDGQSVGKAPVVVDVQPGTHDISAKLSGYTLSSCSGTVVNGVCRVTAEAGKVTEVDLVLKPAKGVVDWQKVLLYGIGGMAIGGILALLEKHSAAERLYTVAREYYEKGRELAATAREVVGRWRPTRL